MFLSDRIEKERRIKKNIYPKKSRSRRRNEILYLFLISYFKSKITNLPTREDLFCVRASLALFIITEGKLMEILPKHNYF